MKELKKEFQQMLHSLLGDKEAEELIAALDTPPVTSIRRNRRKKYDLEAGERVPWCESGCYLKERPEFIFDPLLHAGAYYVQDASSMIYETLTSLLVRKFADMASQANNSDITGSSIDNTTSSQSLPLLKVLDLCAAPGGKTTAIINALPDGSEVTANEYSPKRVGALRENIERWGYPFVTVTNKDSAVFASQGEAFDIVAVDAPCSGEGMMRKEEVARTQWSQDLINQCSALQKDILKNAVDALKPGGFLIYSTCTFNRQENEQNAEYIAEELRLTPIDPDFPKDWGIPRGIQTSLPVYRFMPHRTKGEGLFLAVFRKPGEWQPSPIRKKSVESHEKYPEVEVDRPTAVKYLQGESIKLDDNAPRGIVTITFEGFPLGQAKNIGTRANNLYPKHKRILKR